MFTNLLSIQLQIHPLNRYREEITQFRLWLAKSSLCVKAVYLSKLIYKIKKWLY